ncbi:unnamed protein product [Caenorhabditis brenneri]
MSKFPLLKLPYLALKNVLITMELRSLIASSLCSRHIKPLVRSLFPRIHNLRIVFIDGSREIKISCDNIPNHIIKLGLHSLYSQGPAEIHDNNEKISKERPSPLSNNFDAKQWISHFMDMLRCDGVFVHPLTEAFRLDKIQNALEGHEIQGLSLEEHIPYFLMRTLEALTPSKTLLLYNRPTPFFCHPITRDYDYVLLHFRLSFEELFSLNSKRIKTFMSGINFNLFLKKWMEGWNPRFESLEIKAVFLEFAEEAVLQGIEFFDFWELKTRNSLEKRFKIKNGKGITATVSWSTNDFSHFDAKGRFRLKVRNMNLKDWFDLFMYAFRCNWIELSSTLAWSHSRAAQLLEGLEVSSLFLIHDNNDFIVKTLDMFMPTKELKLSNRPAKEEPYLRNILTRNFDSIHLLFSISLEELCSINSASINIDFLSVKDFNKFLKNWVNGGNPRLQKLDVNVIRNDKTKKYLADYLSGIDINSFKIEEKDGDSWESFNIQRVDGTTAEVSETIDFTTTMTPVTPSFSVLKLPYLAVKNAIITMEIRDMIYLAVCSKKMRRLIRAVFSKSNIMDIEGGRSDFKMKISDDEKSVINASKEYIPTKKLRLRFPRRPDEEMPSLRKIFTRNFNYARINFSLSLEELCSINSASIPIGCLSATDFNEFLKNWVNGGNPKLKNLDVALKMNDKTKKCLVDYFSGIDINSFKIEEKDGDSWESFNIQRVDGTTADTFSPSVSETIDSTNRMTPVTPSFPVLKLPYLAVKNAIITMEICDMIYLAVCSKKMRRLIRSVFSKSNIMDIEGGRSDFKMKISGAISFELAYNSHFHLSHLRLQYHFYFLVPNMQLKYWFDLLMYTFRIENDINVSLWRASSFFTGTLSGQEVSSLFLVLDDGKSVINASKEYIPTKKLRLRFPRRPDEEMSSLRKIFTRNFNYARINFSLSLEELCSINSASISMGCLSVTDFNEFLKNWVNGGNPKLKKLDVVLKMNDKTKKYLVDYISGIDINSFKIEEKGWSLWESFNIQRVDGTTAEVRNTEMATDPFPVNRLPYLARRNVLAVMNMPEFFFQFDGFLRGRTSTPYFEYLDDNPENQPLRHPTFGAREWVQHLMEVLNIGKITAIMFNTGAEDFDPEDLSKVFGNYQLLELLFGNEDYSDEYLRKINELFTPIQSLFLNKKLSNEEDFHRKATNSNVELTNIWYPIDLAGLSVINCPSMAIAKTNMTPTDFNSFIKRWINQTAATKLKQMHIRFPERRFGEDYLPKVFEGVDNQPGTCIQGWVYDRKE